MVLAWAIYSGIPLIAMQYNIIINRIRHQSRATLISYRPTVAVSNIDRSIFAGIARSEKSMAKYV